MAAPGLLQTDSGLNPRQQDLEIPSLNTGIDFIALYRALGCRPECTPEELKRAYRRRVSELHPDRTGDGTESEEALKLLNLGYAAALEFHRSHGRFPAAAPSPRGGSGSATHTRRTHLENIPLRHDAGEEEPVHRSSLWLRLLLLGVLAAFIVSQVATCDGSDALASVGEAQGAVDARAVGVGAHGHLQLGMLPGEVLSLLGAPAETTEGGGLWVYGPSWVRVTCGQVVDWYSSPLRTLAASRAHPGPDDARRDYLPRTDCRG